MSVEEPQHRDVHFWSEGMTEPPCGTLEDRFEWSDALEDVTCEACREALTGEASPSQERDGAEGGLPAP